MDAVKEAYEFFVKHNEELRDMCKKFNLDTAEIDRRSVEAENLYLDFMEEKRNEA